MRYRAATFLIRSVAPEIALGFTTTEEVLDITDKAVEVTPTTLADLAKQSMEIEEVEPVAEPEQQPTTLFEDEK